MLSRLLTRRLRASPRVVKRKMSNYRAKRGQHRGRPRPAKPQHEAISVALPRRPDLS
jgi:hypothetical protein